MVMVCPQFPVRRSLLAAAVSSVLMLITSSISGQTTAQTATQRQLSRIDFAISGAGELTNTVSGVEQRDASSKNSVLTINPSSTVGELVTLRYTAKPYFGLEFNFGNARFTQNYTFTPSVGASIPSAQTGARELTFGYIAHPRSRPFGLQPYLGVGAGTIHFKPTTYGGQGLPPQYRAAYYYTLGVEDELGGSHFGVRAGFRQLIYLSPDFLQNYLTITRRARTSEPNIGVFLRF